MKKSKRLFSFGDVFENKYLGNKITEVLNSSKKRVGWIWTQSNGRTIVSPSLGIYVWFDEKGNKWTNESGADWLVRHR